jgi:predicted metal-binding membrane protein
MPVVGWTTVVAMWWIMMIAMMTPSAAPLVLLHSRVVRHHAAPGNAAPHAPSFALAAGYLAVWLAFAAAAAALQYALIRTQLLSGTMLWSESAALSATVLLAAGAYQLSPLKQACLRHCRAPVEFLTRRWRPGRTGAFIMGVEHGAWCLGCCWMLMALLFVGGVMNLAWIALLAVLVLLEKVSPQGVVASRIAGGALLGWGFATLVV